MSSRNSFAPFFVGASCPRQQRVAASCPLTKKTRKGGGTQHLQGGLVAQRARHGRERCLQRRGPQRVPGLAVQPPPVAQELRGRQAGGSVLEQWVTSTSSFDQSCSIAATARTPRLAVKRPPVAQVLPAGSQAGISKSDAHYLICDRRTGKELWADRQFVCLGVLEACS